MFKKLLRIIINAIRKFNSLCQEYEHLLQTLGIAVGLYLIYLTYISVKISSEQLSITQKQEYQKQLPIWKFDINDKEEKATLLPFSTDVKLEQATAYFSEKLFYKNNYKWDIDQPDFIFHLTLFKSYVKSMILANTKYDSNYFSIATRNDFPVGIELNYIQFGELRSVSAIFSIQYIWVRGENVTITLQGIKFIRYIMSDENLLEELNKVIDKEFKDIKKPKND